MKKIDRTNIRYGYLIALNESEKRDLKGTIYWNCLCDCGNITLVSGSNLTSGKTKSCGCFQKKSSSERAKKLFTKEKTICKVDGCNTDTSKGANGYCGKHYMRVKRYGDENYITPELKRRNSNRESQLKNVNFVKPTTYRKYFGRHEHRVIAENEIGRKLKTDEHVHHIDGNKHNNSKENLIVLSAAEHAKLHMMEKINGKN